MGMAAVQPPNDVPASEKKGILGVVFVTIFLDLMGFGIIIPVQPFLAQNLGASAAIVTMLGAIYSLMQFLFAGFWGRLSDRVGRRPVMLGSIAITAVGYALFGFSSALWLLFLARAISGFGSANIGTAQAVIADSTTPETRAKGMGLIGAAFGLGFIFGPALGGLFSQWGLAAPAFAAAGLATFNVVFAYFKLPETYPAHMRGKKSPGAVTKGFSWKALKHAITIPGVAPLLMLFAVYSTAFSLLEQDIPLFVEHYWSHFAGGDAHLKQAARYTAYILVVVGVVATIIQGALIGKLVRKFGERTLVLAGLTIIGTAFLLYPFVGPTGSFPLMLATSALVALGTGIFNPSITSLVSRAAGPNEQGAVLGLNQSLAALGRIFGPAIAGFLFQISPGTPFATGGIIILACVGVASLIKK